MFEHAMYAASTFAANLVFQNSLAFCVVNAWSLFSVSCRSSTLPCILFPIRFKISATSKISALDVSLEMLCLPSSSFPSAPSATLYLSSQSPPVALVYLPYIVLMASFDPEEMMVLFHSVNSMCLKRFHVEWSDKITSSTSMHSVLALFLGYWTCSQWPYLWAFAPWSAPWLHPWRTIFMLSPSPVHPEVNQPSSIYSPIPYTGSSLFY